MGVSNPENIDYLFRNIAPLFPNIEFGAHLHSTPEARLEKINAAYNAGCRRIDSAIYGFGGCPMAADDLTGNMATETLISYLDEHQIALDINKEKLVNAMQIANKVFYS